MKIKALVVAAAVGFSALAASAFPIAIAGTEGFTVIAGGGGDIIATLEGNSGSYSNDLYLDLYGPGVIFNNHGLVGSTVNLGSYAAGTVLTFRLHVNNTDTDYYTGGAALNPDGNAHARVESNWAPNTTLVSFEDLYNGPFDFNDLSFSFTNTQGTANPTVPDSASTAGCLLLALAGMVGFTRRARRQG